MIRKRQVFDEAPLHNFKKKRERDKDRNLFGMFRHNWTSQDLSNFK
jgi:hypothetical protein